MLAGRLEKALLDFKNEFLALLPREEFDLVLGGLVGAEQTVPLVAAAAVHGFGENVVQPEHCFRAVFEKDALGALSGVNVAVDDGLGVEQDRLGLVRENDLDLRAAFTDQLLVVRDVVDAGERVPVLAEKTPVVLECQNVAVRVDARLVYFVKTYELVSDLVRRVAKHQNDLFDAFRDTS